MVELELLQCRQRAIALLSEREPPAHLRRELVQAVVRGRGLAEKRPRDQDHRHNSQHCPAREAPPHDYGPAGAAPAAYRAARRRCSTASGHIATSAPKTKRKPPAQMRLMSGLT